MKLLAAITRYRRTAAAEPETHATRERAEPSLLMVGVAYLTNCAVSDAGFPRASLALVAGPRGLEAYLPGRCRDIWSRRSSRSTGGAKRSIARASANEPLKPYANDCIE
jgi:hypothetical protein